MATSGRPKVGDIIEVRRDEVREVVPFASVEITRDGWAGSVVLTSETPAGYMAEVIACE